MLSSSLIFYVSWLNSWSSAGKQTIKQTQHTRTISIDKGKAEVFDNEQAD